MISPESTDLSAAIVPEDVQLMPTPGPDPRLITFIADIHADLRSLEDSLIQSGNAVRRENGELQIFDGVFIVITGDVIDRWWDNLAVLRLLVKIQKHGVLIILPGNHELAMLDALSDNPGSAGALWQKHWARNILGEIKREEKLEHIPDRIDWLRRQVFDGEFRQIFANMQPYFAFDKVVASHSLPIHTAANSDATFDTIATSWQECLRSRVFDTFMTKDSAFGSILWNHDVLITEQNAWYADWLRAQGYYAHIHGHKALASGVQQDQFLEDKGVVILNGDIAMSRGVRQDMTKRRWGYTQYNTVTGDIIVDSSEGIHQCIGRLLDDGFHKSVD